MLFKESFVFVAFVMAMAMIVTVSAFGQNDLILSTRGPEDVARGDDSQGSSGGSTFADIPEEFFKQEGGLLIGDDSRVGSVDHESNVRVTDSATVTSNRSVAELAINARERTERGRLEASKTTRLEDEKARDAAIGVLDTMQERYLEMEEGGAGLLEEMHHIMLMLGNDTAGIVAVADGNKRAIALLLGVALIIAIAGVLVYRRYKQKGEGADSDVSGVPAVVHAEEEKVAAKPEQKVAASPKRRRKRRRKGGQKQQKKAQTQTSQ